MHDTRTIDDALHPQLTLGVVLLAAGSASRIGHRPKCLLEMKGAALIERQLHVILNSRVANIVVVLGHYAEQIEPKLKNYPVTLAHNPTPDMGQNSSLHCGLNALPRDLDALMVVLADQPLLTADDFDALIRAFEQRPQSTEVIVPTVAELPGNPVIFSANVRDAITARDSTFGCKQWQIDNPRRVYRWPTTNEHYRIDIDTLEDIEALATRTGLRLQWPAPNSSS